jgi:hypothetical protein
MVFIQFTGTCNARSQLWFAALSLVRFSKFRVFEGIVIDFLPAKYDRLLVVNV